MRDTVSFVFVGVFIVALLVKETVCFLASSMLTCLISAEGAPLCAEVTLNSLHKTFSVCASFCLALLLTLLLIIILGECVCVCVSEGSY